MGAFAQNLKLVRSCQQNDVESVRRLLSQGHLVERLDNRRFRRQHQGRTALMAASEAGHFEAMLVLLEAGADVNRRNKGGCTALWLAAGRGHLSAVELLLAHGGSATMSGSDQPPRLHICGHSEPLRDTPLHRSVYGQQFQDICEQLRCSSISHPSNQPVYTMRLASSVGLSSGAAAANNETISVHRFRRLVLLLVQNGARLDTLDNRGRTALQLAIELGCASAARVLSQLHMALFPTAAPRLSYLSDPKNASR